MHGYPFLRISVFNYPYFTAIHLNIHGFLWISIWISMGFYGHPFGYPWVSMDINALTCSGFSIQGMRILNGSLRVNRHPDHL